MKNDHTIFYMNRQDYIYKSVSDFQLSACSLSFCVKTGRNEGLSETDV